jgi:predicted lipoprotein
MRILLTIILLGLAMSAPVEAKAQGIDHKAVVLRVARDYIVPRYATLADAAENQTAAWARFCASPDVEGFGGLQAAFQRTADAWSGIEFVLYGPIGTGFRFERMAHWPERNNAVSRGLAGLLARSDDLTPERFAGTSAATQGLTALERLLYEPSSRQALLPGDGAAKRRCVVGAAIAAGLATRSRDVVREWRAADGPTAKLEAGDAAIVDEALTRIATDEITSLEIILDKKLAAVMGKRMEETRPTLAEGWRSGRSMRAIALNLESDAALTVILFGSDKRGESLLDALRTAQRLAEGLPPDIGKLAADPKQRSRLVLLRDAVRSARDLAEMTLPDALGVTIGFNSRDGD